MAQKTDLERAYEALTGKRALYTKLWAYYHGDAPLKYVSERLREVFQDKEARFSMNWCAPVVDSELERITLTAFTAPDEALTTRLNDLWQMTELNLDAPDVHLAALVCGESFVFVWRDEGEDVEAYYHDPRLCHIFYDPEKPRRKQFAAKWWVGDDERARLNLYYADRIEYYESTRKADHVQNAKAFDLIDTASNPYDVVPVFHFRPDRRAVRSALHNAIDPQDALNKLFADMMVSGEFGAFKQRWFVTNADVGAIKSSPSESVVLPAGDSDTEGTQVGQFDATDLTNYMGAMDHIANTIAKITRIPKHYFMAQGGDPSGEALIAMEAPLNKKAQTHIDRFMPVWREVAAFMLQLDGTPVDARQIVPTFDPPETVQPRTQAEIRQINANAGLPLKTTLRWEGKSDEEIADVEQDMAAERTAQQATLAAALLETRRRAEQDGNAQSEANGDGR